MPGEPPELPENVSMPENQSNPARVITVGEHVLSDTAFRMALILGVSAFLWLAWSFYSVPQISRWLHYPTETAIRVVDRTMDYTLVAEKAGWTTHVLQWVDGYSEERARIFSRHVVEDVRRHLEASDGNDFGLVDLGILQAVLHGEAGETNEMVAVLYTCNRTDRGIQASALLRVAYLGEQSHGEDVVPFAGDSMVQSEWARDMLAMKLAAVLERRSELASAVQRLRDRATGTLRAVEAVSIAMTGLLIAGLCWLVGWATTRAGSPVVAVNSPLATWSARDGVCVLLFAEAATVVLWELLPWLPIPPWQTLGYYCHQLVPTIVAVSIVYLVLLKPRCRALSDFLGLLGSPKIVLGGGLVLFAVDIMGANLISVVGRMTGYEGSWAEGLNESLIYGEGMGWGMVLLNVTVLGPAYEELLMRGVLFSTLRSRFGFVLSSTASSIIFAGLHFYSLAGFVSVIWFGIVACWVYERTRSLPACFVGHFLTNLFVFWYQVAALG